MSLFAGAELIEVLNLIASGAGLFRGKGVHQGGQQPSSGANGTVSKGFLVTLAEIGVKWWEESGGSFKDESELMKSLHGDTAAKHTKLEQAEAKKIVALIKAMEPKERVVFRLSLFLMKPEVAEVKTPEKKAKDAEGKERVTQAASSKFERTGVDMRINTLKGIAELINDDLCNVADIALMLRDEGALGSENKALRAYRSGVEQLQSGLCRLFEVDTVADITMSVVSTKLEAWTRRVPPVPVPMSIIGRFFNMLLMGNKAIPEPIYQSQDGGWKSWKGYYKPILRMLGIQTKRS
jgi:hypothetical protein